MSQTQWIEIANGAADVAQVAAIAIGAIWAYFKFVRSRTFANRLELTVQGSLLQHADQYAVIVNTSLYNRGLVRVRLHNDAKSVYLFGLDTSRWARNEAIEWGEHLRVERIFGDHDRIEAQEVITDRLLVPVGQPPDPTDRWLAFRIKCVVANRRRKIRRKAFRWTAVAIIPGDSVAVHNQEQNDASSAPGLVKKV